MRQQTVRFPSVVIARSAALLLVFAAALGGAGCQSFLAVDFDGAQPRSAGTDAGGEPDADAEDAADAADAGGDGSCVGSPPATYPDRPAYPPSPTACSVADVAAGRKILSNPAWSETALAAALSTNCGDCIFSEEAHPTWSSIVYLSSGPIVNDSHCIEQQYGVSCGRAAQRYELCNYAMCHACEADRTSLAACELQAGNGECKQQKAEASTACVAAAAAGFAKCMTIEDLVFTGCR